MTGELIPASKKFNDYTFKYYIDSNADCSSCFWADWRQVGEILDRLSAPNTRFGKLKNEQHNKDFETILYMFRQVFDKLSKTITVNAVSTDNLSVYPKEITLVSFKGLLELFRYSASDDNVVALIDFLWGIADEIKAGNNSRKLELKKDVLPSIRMMGSYSLNRDNPALLSGIIDSARIIIETAGIKGNQAALALDKMFKSYTGKSALQTCEIALTAPTKKQILTQTEIG